MRILLTGQRGVPLAEIGEKLASTTGLKVVDGGILVPEDGGEVLLREMFKTSKPEEYRELERKAVAQIGDRDWCILVVEGSALLDPDSRRRLRDKSVIVFLSGSEEELWKRVADDLPGRVTETELRECCQKQYSLVEEVVRPFADVALDVTGLSCEETAGIIREEVGKELALRCGAANTFGEIIRATTFGESHGPAIGAVLDGVRPGLEISLEEIQREMDRRRPGQSAVTTPRKEADRVYVLSGMFEGKTTGAPISMIIYSRDQDPSKYEGLRDVFRPGHADFTYYRKYGIRDHRGGGRSSGRETAARVAAGAVARQILAQRGVKIVAHAIEIAGVRAESRDYDVIEKNPVRCADPAAAKRMEEAILAARDENDSVGGIVQLEIEGVPPGLGDPVFGKLDARLTGALMTIGAVKGVEVGRGFALARARGSEANDAMADGGFLSNNAGGITGGISTGQPIVMRLVVKPTSSIARPQRTMDVAGRNREVEVHGRHDPCIVPRVIPVVEHMAALVILDAWEIQSRLRPEWVDSTSR